MLDTTVSEALATSASGTAPASEINPSTAPASEAYDASPPSNKADGPFDVGPTEDITTLLDTNDMGDATEGDDRDSYTSFEVRTFRLYVIAIVRHNNP